MYQTCVTALIGDDIEAVCKFAGDKLGKPVIPVNAPGFAGSKNLGNKLGGEALLDHVIGTREPEYTTPYDINIIGEYNLVGELWQVKPLLDTMGIRILSMHLRRRTLSRSRLVPPGQGRSCWSAPRR